MTLRSALSSPAATERDTAAVEEVRAGHARLPVRGTAASPATADESRAYSGTARTTDPFYDDLAILLEGSIRGLVGEYRGDLRAGSGHRPCDRCGCIGVKA